MDKNLMVSNAMTNNSIGEFYGEYYSCLNSAINYMVAQTKALGELCSERIGRNPIESVKSRIKSPESMAEKLRRRGCEVNAKNAVSSVHDAAGIRIITSFLDDVEKTAAFVKHIPGIRVVEEKDYVNHPKKNGYRSYHIICELLPGTAENEENIFVEVQIRTIAMDTWASVEHSMKYKKCIGNEQLIVEELKRYADELASIDLSLQTLREIISGGMENEDIVCGGRESDVRCCCGNSSS